MRALPADVLIALERAFRRLGLRWYVFGAQAAALHGAARLTIDVDVTVALGTTPVEKLVDTLQTLGVAPRGIDAEFVRDTGVLPVVHTASGIPIDIVLAGPGLEEQFMDRAIQRRIRGVAIPVASAEDIVAMKVLAGRAKDRDDVLAVLRAAAGAFRFELVRQTLALLEQALDRRDLLPAFEQAASEAALGWAAAKKRPVVSRPRASKKKKIAKQVAKRAAKKKSR
jgi:hypothetical protein